MCWAGAGRGGGGQVSSISSIGPGKGEEIGVMCPGSGHLLAASWSVISGGPHTSSSREISCQFPLQIQNTDLI